MGVGQGAGSSSLVQEFESYLVWEFEILGEFSTIHDFGVLRLLLRD